MPAVGRDLWFSLHKRVVTAMSGFDEKLKFDRTHNIGHDGVGIPVAWTEVDKRYVVSTVFLGINHQFKLDSPPLVFETMVFRKKRSSLKGKGKGRTGGWSMHGDYYIDRYTTWEQALSGHWATVKLYKNPRLRDQETQELNRKRGAKWYRRRAKGFEQVWASTTKEGTTEAGLEKVGIVSEDGSVYLLNGPSGDSIDNWL